MQHTDQRAAYTEIAQSRGISLSAEDLDVIESIYADASPTREAESLAAHFTRDGLSSAVLTYMVPPLWRFRADRCAVPMETWRAMFTGCRYTHDFIVARRPLRWWSRTLFRGATDENRFGLSWTGDIEQARYFARSRQAPGVRGSIWTCHIPVTRVLARLQGMSFEDEYVADVEGCTVELIEAD